MGRLVSNRVALCKETRWPQPTWEIRKEVNPNADSSREAASSDDIIAALVADTCDPRVPMRLRQEVAESHTLDLLHRAPYYF